MARAVPSQESFGPATRVGRRGHAAGSMSAHNRRRSVQVNSEAREARIRSIIAEALGDRAIYRMTEMISMEQAMEEGAE
jgi:hypothetical protein